MGQTLNKWGKVIYAIVLIVLGIGVIGKFIDDSKNKTPHVDQPEFSVNAINLKLHSGPSKAAEKVATLPMGTKVRVLQTHQHGWDQIVVDVMGDTGQAPAEQLDGYVKGAYLTAITRPAPASSPANDISLAADTAPSVAAPAPANDTSVTMNTPSMALSDSSGQGVLIVIKSMEASDSYDVDNHWGCSLHASIKNNTAYH